VKPSPSLTIMLLKVASPLTIPAYIDVEELKSAKRKPRRRRKRGRRRGQDSTKTANLHQQIEPNDRIGESLDHLLLLEDLVLDSKLVRPESLAGKEEEEKRASGSASATTLPSPL